MKITYEKSGSWHLVYYRVIADGKFVGRTHRNYGGWSAQPADGTMRPPTRLFPTRKAAGEWLVAASGLWLVNP